MDVRTGRLGVGFVLGFLLAGCGHSSTSAPAAQPSPTVSSVAVGASGRFTGIGQQVSLSATATLNNGTTQTVTSQATWQTSNAGVVSVSPAGVATSVAEGDARITAVYQNVSGSADLPVRILWTVQGRVVSNPDGAGIAGARIAAEDGATATTSASGEFALEGAGAAASRRVTISADGYITRTASLRTSDPRTGLALDLIANRSPFSLTFYRQIARAAEDYPTSPLLEIRRWETNPNFYIKTTNQSSLDVGSGVVNEVRAVIALIVPQVSSGKLSAGTIETGPTARPVTAGWINVEFTNEITSCGQAPVGGNWVKINPICSCYGYIEAHEISHALGLWHHATVGGLMSHVQPTYCATSLSDLEAYHSKLVYTRPNGNTDPDNDPATVLLAGPLGMGEGPVLSCGHRPR
jgi:hypothetical protein